MNYIGSKLSLLDFLDDAITKITGSEPGIFCDPFAGTGAVGTLFKKKGHRVIANDIQYYSYVLNRHYIGNHRELSFLELGNKIPGLLGVSVHERKTVVCDHLDRLQGEEGFVFHNFCPGGTRDKEYQRQYFSDENGKRCDAIRRQIENWHESNAINEDEYFFLLATLLESIDKRANTASVYGAFLKKIKKTATTSIEFKPAECILNDSDHMVLNENANDVASKYTCDILYLDPPYNHRQFATNYHILETIARYDNPKVHGKTGLREYAKQKSDYCSRTRVRDAFRDLISNARTKFIFLSYNNEGLMTVDDVREIMSTRGEYGLFKKLHGRFRADKEGARNHKTDKTEEYLHYVICR